MDKQALVKLFDYHYWANRRLWYTVSALSEQQFTQALKDGSPSIRTQIVRMVSNENLWVNYLWHGEVEFLQEYHIPTRARIRAEWDALEAEMRDFIDELSPAALERWVEPVFLTTRKLKVEEILLQIVKDAMESRAQLWLHLEGMGSPSPIQDFLGSRVEQQAVPV
jgi:uncharacterized damage-inducible protein DinB